MLAPFSFLGGAAANLFLLDEISGGEFAYALFQLKSTATNCIRVRRSSDNSEQDFGFVAGALDTSSLLSFVGANNGFIVTWYDQTGNGYNATLSTASQQLRIVTSGAMTTLGGINAGIKPANNGFYTISTYSQSAAPTIEDYAITAGNEHQQIAFGGSWNWVTRPDGNRMVLNTPTNYNFTPISNDITALHISNMVMNNTSVSMYYDKVIVGNQTVVAIPSRASTSIWEWDANRYGALFIRFAKNLSGSERTIINDFFTDKYGL